MKKQRRAVLFANGSAKRPDLLERRGDDYLIVVDGGMRYMAELGLTPDLLVGDLDSIKPEQLAELERTHTEVLRFNPQKDHTDLELALLTAIDRGFKEIVIAFALGGRFDHAMGNLSLLEYAKDREKALTVSFDDGLTRIYLVQNKFQLKVAVEDTVSLVPWREDVLVGETCNLAYPLHNETLPFGTTRGISNVALAETISVSVIRGALLLIHTKKLIETERTSVERKEND